MSNKEIVCIFKRCGYHKGFYNNEDLIHSLQNIKYTDFFKIPDDEYFPFVTAEQLLCGGCNYFALSLKKIFGYTPYIIEGKNNSGFHVFCQIYKNKIWYYVDARGITSSFNEFMDIVKVFVHDEYVIRPVNPDDVKEWEDDSIYNEAAYTFAEKVINNYKECYKLD